VQRGRFVPKTHSVKSVYFLCFFELGLFLFFFLLFENIKGRVCSFCLNKEAISRKIEIIFKIIVYRNNSIVNLRISGGFQKR